MKTKITTTKGLTEIEKLLDDALERDCCYKMTEYVKELKATIVNVRNYDGELVLDQHELTKLNYIKQYIEDHRDSQKRMLRHLINAKIIDEHAIIRKS